MGMEASRKDCGMEAIDAVRVIDRGEGIFVLRVDDAAGGNRLTCALANAITDALTALVSMPDLRVLVIEGGDDVFLRSDRSDLNAAMAAGLYRALRELPATVVAAMRGGATGAGFLFAALCDHIVCDHDAEYGFVRIEEGLVPSAAEFRLFEARFESPMAWDLLYRLPTATAGERFGRGWTCLVETGDAVVERAHRLARELAEHAGNAQTLLREQRRSRLAEPLQAWVPVDVVDGNTSNGTDIDALPAQSEWLSFERPAHGVLLVRIRDHAQSGNALQVVQALEALIDAQHAVPTDVRALVLTSSHPDVLPPDDDDIALTAARRLRALAYRSRLPIAMALPAEVGSRGWLLGQCFDMAAHPQESNFSAADLVSAGPEWIALAAECFASRLGDLAAREIVLATGAYSGKSLKTRFGTLDVVLRDQVETHAIAVARTWAVWPDGVIARSRHAGFPAALPAPDAHSGELVPASRATPGALVIASPAVQATLDADGVVSVRMSDRESKNLFTPAIVQGLDEVFAQVAANDACKVVVLAGYDRYFATGGTRESLHAIQSGQAKFTDAPVFVSALRCPVPVVACMQGHAVGGGLSLGLFADFALFAAESQYLNPYLRYGFTPGGGATLIVPGILGSDLGYEALCTAREYSGSDLRARHPALAVHPRAELDAQAMALARRVARHPRAMLVSLKAYLNRSILDRLDAVFQQEIDMHAQSFVGRSDALERIHAHFGPDVVAAPGDTSNLTNEHDMMQASPPGATAVQPPSRAEIISDLRTLLAQELHVHENEIGEGVPFVDLGLDSITGVTWVRKINTRFAIDLPATRVYSHPTLASMADHVEESMPASADTAPVAVAVPKPDPKPDPKPKQATAPVARVALAHVAEAAPAAVQEAASPSAWGSLLEARGRLTSWNASPALPGPARHSDEIAIIGMAGQFPQARNVDEYWANLAEGRLCVGEIPRERWDMDMYYQPGDPAPGKVNAKWMGCLADYDCFDPSFFDISPREAISMDPQQRVFLQSCWHAIEHAGYNPRALSGTRCGVFVGCGQGEYHLLSSDLQNSALGFTGNDTSILAGRVSYFLNLQGPCLAVETACSSSLVAISMACDNLVAGTCDSALVGGVGVIATPHLLVKMAQTGMLSPDGRCFTFDQRANGFVPGEAVGALLLKRVADAERDGDTILGVVRGWGVNQDGKTNGITAPNPDAQARLQQDVHARFGIDPASIQMVEAHGTGTKLGDPIEVEALKRAFATSAKNPDTCALGSVKSNIGHCFTAAGVASVIKVLLSLQHGKLAPTINFERLNEHIDLKGSPFYVNDRLRDWSAPAAGPRMAAVSSFGFGGTNAHLVIGEYVGNTAAATEPDALRRFGKLPIVLSARSVEQLDAQARQLRDLLVSRGKSIPLTQLAYTLQVGRESMDERLGVMAGSIDELIQLLGRYVSGDTDAGKLIRGTARDHRKTMGFLLVDADMREVVVDRLLKQGQLPRLLELWTHGLAVDWNRLYGEALPKRLGLPGYPFARQRYWIDSAGVDEQSVGAAKLHPLLHRNVSTLRQHAYASSFSGTEPFLEHPDGGEPGTLPATAYLEMARAALQQAWDGGACAGWRLTDIAWGDVYVSGPAAPPLCIVLAPETPDNIDFEIYSQADGVERIHCQGRAQVVADANAALPAALAGHRIPVELPNCGLAHADVLLHPWLIESVVRAIAQTDAGRSCWAGQPVQPVALGSLWVSAACRGLLTAWVEWETAAESRLSVALYDAQGQSCARWTGLQVAASTQGALIPVPASLATAPPMQATAMSAPRLARADLLRGMRESLARALYLKPSDIANDKPFIEMGLDSIVGVEWINELNKAYGIKLAAARLYDYPSLDELASHLEGVLEDGRISVPTTSLVPVESFAPMPAPVLSAPMPAPVLSAPRLARADLLRGMRESLARALYLKPSDIANDKPFIEMGLDSIVGVEWINELNKAYGIKLAAARLYDYPSLDELASHLEGEIEKVAPIQAQPVPSPASAPEVAMPKVARTTGRRRLERRTGAKPAAAQHAATQHAATQHAAHRGSGRIAVVGMSGRYPQAGNLTQFWANLAEGRNAITEVPPSRWDVEKYYDPDPRKEGGIYCKWIGMLDDIESFDPLFFRISPAEAKNMDPQHRLFMEESYRAFEHAGYARQSLSNTKCGVYVGIIGSEYASLVPNSIDITGTNPAIGAARIAYFLNLKGPAIAIDTACSASLIAIHLACQGLMSHETDMALAGGVSVYLHPETYMGMCKAGMLSPDGQCRTFDDGANGFVPGEGVGAVVLKRLEDAERDNDVIYGVIVGSAINQDGKTNGITAPSVKSQIELERDLYATHDIHPETITYVETHGTGTRIGDPIELEALSTVFRERTQKKHYCALGSVKSNIGHASGAAGVASVHKVLLSMQHRTLVPTLNVTKENTLFDFEDSPFYVSRSTKAWESPGGAPRRATVSSFGFSGTNAHLVIEEYIAPAGVVSNTSADPLPVVLSARTADQLRRRAKDLLEFIGSNLHDGSLDLASMAYTLLEGREALDERLALIVRSVDELEAGLNAFLDGGTGASTWFAGKVQRDEDGLPQASAGGRTLATAENGVATLAQAWVRGDTLTWAMLEVRAKTRRMALPTYPFAAKRYWVDPLVAPKSAAPAPAQQRLGHHVPMSESPAPQERTYRVDMAAIASRARDGAVPAAAFLEVVRAALAEDTGDAGSLVLGDVAWGQPLIPAPNREAQITVFRQQANQWAFEIHSFVRGAQGASGEQIHCQGQALVAAAKPLPGVDLAALRGRLTAVARADDEDRIETVFRGNRELLVCLRSNGQTARHGDARQPDSRSEQIDAALRSAAWLTSRDASALSDCSLPDALESLREGASRATSASGWRWAWIRVASGVPGKPNAMAVDIDLCDADGAATLRLEGVTYDRLTVSVAPESVAKIDLRPALPAVQTPPPAVAAAGRQRIALAEVQ